MSGSQNVTEATESERIDTGLYRLVDKEYGYLVYQSVFDGETTGVAAVPLQEMPTPTLDLPEREEDTGEQGPHSGE